MARSLALALLGVLPMTGVPRATAADSPAKALDDLAREYWEFHLRVSPVEATALGDRRYDDRLGDNSPAGMASERAALEALRARVQAVDSTALSPADRVNRSQLLGVIRDDIDYLSTGMETWVLDPMNGPQVGFLNIPSFQLVRTPAEGQAMVARWRAMGPWIDQSIANLRRGLAAGLSSASHPANKVASQLDELLAKPIEEWAIVEQPLKTDMNKWSDAEKKEFREGLTAAVREVVKPAFERYRTFVKKEALPVVRSQEKPGLVALPGGVDLYKRMIRVHTSLDLAPQTIHETGLAEVARINREMQELGQKVLGVSDLAEIRKRLRSDPALHFKTREEVEAKAIEALRRAEAAMPKWFGTVPKTSCVVKRIEEHEEKYSTIAYYRQPATDGSRPGTYYINTYAPETRPRYEAEALAFHEAVPGHHTQIAFAQELKEVPEFRKHTGTTAYVEGWGLYSERLANEMGLYSSDLDRIGMLSYDAWRACRLVVDTGLHAMGWSRQQAIDYMLQNTALAENNIVNEVDRYISWPGQAVAYKTGQMEILRLREEARKRLGDKFDIRKFHDAVLGQGAVSLETLRQTVEGVGKEL